MAVKEMKNDLGPLMTKLSSILPSVGLSANSILNLRLATPSVQTVQAVYAGSTWGPCGGGSACYQGEALRYREIWCANMFDFARLESMFCQGSLQPASSELCPAGLTRPPTCGWKVLSNWSACFSQKPEQLPASLTKDVCNSSGKGLQYRQVSCLAANSTARCEKPKPRSERPCQCAATSHSFVLQSTVVAVGPGARPARASVDMASILGIILGVLTPVTFCFCLCCWCSRGGVKNPRSANDRVAGRVGKKIEVKRGSRHPSTSVSQSPQAERIIPTLSTPDKRRSQKYENQPSRSPESTDEMRTEQATVCIAGAVTKRRFEKLEHLTVAAGTCEASSSSPASRSSVAPSWEMADSMQNAGTEGASMLEQKARESPEESPASWKSLSTRASPLASHSPLSSNTSSLPSPISHSRVNSLVEEAGKAQRLGTQIPAADVWLPKSKETLQASRSSSKTSSTKTSSVVPASHTARSKLSQMSCSSTAGTHSSAVTMTPQGLKSLSMMQDEPLLKSLETETMEPYPASSANSSTVLLSSHLTSRASSTTLSISHSGVAPSVELQKSRARAARLEMLLPGAAREAPDVLPPELNHDKLPPGPKLPPPPLQRQAATARFGKELPTGLAQPQDVRLTCPTAPVPGLAERRNLSRATGSTLPSPDSSVALLRAPLVPMMPNIGDSVRQRDPLELPAAPSLPGPPSR